MVHVHFGINIVPTTDKERNGLSRADMFSNVVIKCASRDRTRDSQLVPKRSTN